MAAPGCEHLPLSVLTWTCLHLPQLAVRSALTPGLLSVVWHFLAVKPAAFLTRVRPLRVFSSLALSCSFGLTLKHESGGQKRGNPSLTLQLFIVFGLSRVVLVGTAVCPRTRAPVCDRRRPVPCWREARSAVGTAPERVRVGRPERHSHAVGQ